MPTKIIRASSFSRLQEVRQILAQRKFINFCQYVTSGFIAAPHHTHIAQRLDNVLDGKINRLMLAMPPRHGKSYLVSELFPAFWLAHNPTKQIIHISYAAALSNSFSMKVRALVRDNARYRELFPGITLDPARQRLDDWKLAEGGGFKSIGVTGGITGHGADLMLIDDPHKEGDEQSGRQLQAVFDWYIAAARTRLSPGAAIVFPMTRWHPRDLAGRLLELAKHDDNADQWEVINYPALAIDGDNLGRKPGQALWPERFDERSLLAIKATSERYFEALFQQNPKVTNEPLFKLGDFVREDIEPVGKPFWTIDLALQDHDRADYNVIGRWSYDKKTLVLHHVERFRSSWSKTKRKLADIMLEYREPMYFPRQFLELVAVQSLKVDVPDTRAFIKEIGLPGDKVARGQVLSDVCQNKKVVICLGMQGDLFVREHCSFPDELEHDDFVDMSSVATHALRLDREFMVLVARIENVRKSKRTISENGSAHDAIERRQKYNKR